MRVVEATRDEVDAIHDLILETAREEVFPLLTASGRAHFERTLRQDVLAILGHPDKQYLVTGPPDISGVCGFSIHGHINHLFVARDAQGQGVGKALLQAAIDRIEADVVELNASLNAIDFYERLGFEYIGTPQLANGVSYQRMRLSVSAVLRNPEAS